MVSGSASSARVSVYGRARARGTHVVPTRASYHRKGEQLAHFFEAIQNVDEKRSFVPFGEKQGGQDPSRQGTE